MFRLNWRLTPFVGVVCFVTSAASSSGDALNVRVEPHKSTFFVGEPVLITAVVTNPGSEPVKVFYHNAPTLAPDPPSIVDLLFGADELHVEHWSDGLRKVSKMGPKLIAPGESVTIDLVMLFSREDGFFVKVPGTYWIQGRAVIASSPYVEVLSPPVAIEVREPSRVDRSAWQWLDAHKEEYGRLVQTPWEAKMSDEFLEECDRLCSASQSKYVEYLALFLSRSYREGPKKDAAEAGRFADIAKTKASSEKIRSEADKLSRAVQPPLSPSAIAQSEVDPEIRIAVAERVEGFGSALTSGRMDECASALSEDFLYNGALDKTRALAELESEFRKVSGGVVTIRVDSFSRGPTVDEVEVSGRYMIVAIGREPSTQTVRWGLRREGSRWVIRRWDRAS